jgi:uncharacterized membrane protein
VIAVVLLELTQLTTMHEIRYFIGLLASAVVMLAGSLAIGLSAIAQAHNHLHGEFSEGVGIGLLIAGGVPFLICLIKCAKGTKQG